jgi:hypothetical protein
MAKELNTIYKIQKKQIETCMHELESFKALGVRDIRSNDTDTDYAFSSVVNYWEGLSDITKYAIVAGIATIVTAGIGYAFFYTPQIVIGEGGAGAFAIDQVTLNLHRAAAAELTAAIAPHAHDGIRKGTLEHMLYHLGDATAEWNYILATFPDDELDYIQNHLPAAVNYFNNPGGFA